jgi:hypothetical protein
MSASPQDRQVASLNKDVLLPCLLLVTGSLAIVCGWQRSELQRLRTALTGNVPAAQPVMRSARAQTFVVAPHTAPATNVSRPLNEDGSEFATPTPFSFKARPPAASPLARLLNNPEFFQALQLHRQATLDTKFAPLFRQLALTEAELNAFKRLLAEKENAALDVIAVSETQPEGPLPDPILGASINAARARAEGAIRSALGDERYAVYADFEKSLPQRTVVAQLEQRLSYTPNPLSPAQAESLVKVLAARSPAPASAETAPTSAVVVTTGALAAAGIELRTPPAPVSNDALTDAQTLLNQSQLAALRDIQAEQQATAQAYQLIRDTLPANKKFDAIAWQLLLQ